jgi:hypothetical protein
VAKQLLRQLLDADAATAAVLLTQGADLTRAVGTVRKQPLLVAEADRLVRVADETRRPLRLRYRNKALALFADPSDRSGVRFVGNVTLPPSARVSLVGSAIVGHCLNAREMLFGIDARRAMLLDSASVALADLPRAAELVDADSRWLRRWLADQSGVARENVRGVQQTSRPSPLLRSLGWIGLGAVRDRMLFCRALSS